MFRQYIFYEPSDALNLANFSFNHWRWQKEWKCIMFCFFCHNFPSIHISVFTVPVNIFLCLAYVYWLFPVYCVSFSYPVWFLLLVILSIFTCVDYFCPCLFPHLFHSEQTQVYIIAQVSHLFSLFFPCGNCRLSCQFGAAFFVSLSLFFLSLYPEFSTPQIWIISLAASWHALCQT